VFIGIYGFSRWKLLFTGWCVNYKKCFAVIAWDHFYIWFILLIYKSRNTVG